MNHQMNIDEAITIAQVGRLTFKKLNNFPRH